MASTQQFCLRWNNHQSTLVSVFDHLLESGTLVDCTLAAEGQFLKAHKVVLSACSPYLEALLSQHYEKHPIIILKDVTFHELKSMLDYMYRGEVNISQEQLTTFLKAAESLQIKGLTDCGAFGERELDRPSEMDYLRDIKSVDRSVGVPSTKRIDTVRKQIPIIPFVRSPLIGLPQNFMVHIPLAADNQKSNKHPSPVPQEINSRSPSAAHNREGSLSPTIKRKRQCLPQSAQSEEPKINSKPVENNLGENNQNCIKSSKNKDGKESLPTNTSNSVPPNNFLQESKTAKDKNQSKSYVINSEVKTENVDFLNDMHNDDSVEDHLTVDEEEEEMDEMDLSRPGPSNQTNSHVAATPWHVAGEGNGEDLLLASQQDSQDVSGMRHVLECSKCHKTYSSPHTLRRHVRLECGQEPRFLCPYCPHRTKQRYNLMLHIGRTHRDCLQSAGVMLEK